MTTTRPVDKALETGIHRRFVDVNGTIIGPAWYRAFEAKEIVGTCRQHNCDGLMVAQPTHTDDKITWYGAECLSCGAEIAAPNGNTLPRSSRRHEMPDGAWERHENYLKRMRDAGRAEAA